MARRKSLSRPRQFVSFSKRLLENKEFLEAVRRALRTDEHVMYFDFITDLPQDFLMKYVGTRITHKKIATYLNLEVVRVASLNKAIRRVSRRLLESERFVI